MLANQSKNYFIVLILLFFSACASDEAKPRPPCAASTNMGFDTFIQSAPATIIYQNSSCEDITSLYGPENDKVFFLQIKDDNVYKPSANNKDERYIISKDNAMITYKKIAGKSVIIFQSSMFGAIYAFSPDEGMPSLAEITYPRGYIPKNGEIIAQIEDGKIIFMVTEDIPAIGEYKLYTLKKGSQIEIAFTK